MNIPLLFHTVIHLKPKQIYYQIKYRLYKAKYKQLNCERYNQLVCDEFIPKYNSFSDGQFTFLNLSKEFVSWNDSQYGMLWAYNLNYMDYLLQKDMQQDIAIKWIDNFIQDVSANNVGKDPYPIALRNINWIKFFSLYPNYANKERIDCLYSFYKLLAKKVEYHLLGNHLLEDACSLFICSFFFADSKGFVKYSKLLLQQIKEQTLKDGMHYEQSPMYHCILLDRLLDCYNFSIHNVIFKKQVEVNRTLKQYCEAMLGALQSLIWQDGSIPMLNDSANNIAPQPKDIFAYANKLNLVWQRHSLKDCGYRKLCNNDFETIIDVGNITATYQPGHTHADTFSYELRIDGKPFIVDTGISTYNKTSRRQYERSTIAHNTVSVNGKNSTEAWDNFRVAKRAKVNIIKENSNMILAQHDGFKTICKRKFSLSDDNTFSIEDDIYENGAISYIHLSQLTTIISISDTEIKTNQATISIQNANNIEILDGQVSTEYNVFDENKIIKIYFNTHCKYSIKI